MTHAAAECAPRAKPLCGASILLVEDDAIIALDMAGLLEEAGAVVIGPFARVRDALGALAEGPDAALLDIEIADGTVFPLADRMREAGLAIVFHSGGADRRALARAYPGAPLCEKPSSATEIIGALEGVLS